MLHQHYGTTAPSLRSHWRIHNCKRNHLDTLRSCFNRQLLDISTQPELKQLVQLATAQHAHPTWSFGVKTATVWAVCTFWRADCTLLHPTSLARAAAVAWWKEAMKGSWLHSFKQSCLDRRKRDRKLRAGPCTAAANITSESLLGFFARSCFWMCMRRNLPATG